MFAFLQLDSRKHSGVISFFDKYFVKTGIFRKEFSKIVHKSFDFRQVIDYDGNWFQTLDGNFCQTLNCELYNNAAIG